MFTMYSAFALVVIPWLLCLQLVWALLGAEHIRRQCDLLACDPKGDNWFTGVFGGLLEWIDNSLDWDSTTTDDSKIDTRIPATPAPAQPDDEIFIQVEDLTGSERCEANAPADPGPQSAISADTGLHPCGPAKQQTIWPKSCKDVTRNGFAARLLAGMDVHYVTTSDPLCKVEGDIFFWMAWLTQEQIGELNAQQSATGIDMIVTNVPYDFGKIISSSPVREARPLGSKNSQRKKRAALSVIRQELSSPALSFLSTAEGDLNVRDYIYLSPAGDGVRVYLVDAGFDSAHPDFHGRTVRWIFAQDIHHRQSNSEPPKFEAPDSEGAGTCAASLIVGDEFGVAKKTELIMVKAGPSAGSIISAIEEVIRDIYDTVSRRPSNGWTVVQISGGFAAEPSVNYLALRLSSQINFLVKKWGVVVVTSAGYNENDYYEDINEWPALLSQDQEHNVISVGSVLSSVTGHGIISYGERYPWSRGGSTATVSAPGDVYCAGLENSMMALESSFASAAIVTGLIAYFLSLRDVADTMRSSENTPRALIDFLKLMSYSRFEDHESVWNGLDSNNEALFVSGVWMWRPPPSKSAE